MFLFSLSTMTLSTLRFLEMVMWSFLRDNSLYNPYIISFSCVRVYSVVFGCVVFQLFLLCSLFQFESSCFFSVFSVALTVLWSCCCNSPFIFCVFLIFQCQEANNSILSSDFGQWVFGLLFLLYCILSRFLSFFSYTLFV